MGSKILNISGWGSSRLPAEPQMLCLNFEVVRQVWSPSLCGPVLAVPREMRMSKSYFVVGLDDLGGLFQPMIL